MSDYGLNGRAYQAGTISGYYHALDQFAYRTPDMRESPGVVGVPTPDTEEAPIDPIIPANELGTTVVEIDPRTGANIIQNIQSSIKRGVGNMQLVLTTPSHQVLGGRPKAYGKEVRTAIREMIEAAGVKLNGVEMPTSSITNLSGFNPQRMNLLEEKRQQDLQEVRDALRFAADIGGGGGVDIWSQEYTRSIYDQDWAKDAAGKQILEAHPGEKALSVKYLIDDRTGAVLDGIRTSQTYFVPVWERFDKGGVDAEGKPVAAGDLKDVEGKKIELDYSDPRIDLQLMRRVPVWDHDKREFRTEPLEWETIKDRTKEHNEKFNTQWTPEEYAYRSQVENRIAQSRGQSMFYSRRYEEERKELMELLKVREKWKKIEETTPESEHYKLKEEFRKGHHTQSGQTFLGTEFLLPSVVVQRDVDNLVHDLKHIHEASSAADAQASQALEDYRHIQAMSRFAKGKSVMSYAELGIEAMQETKTNPKVKPDSPLYVGPEIGWPEAYGGHPKEFVELIKDSRKKMVELLTKEEVVDPSTGQKIKSEFYQAGVSPDEAKELAKKHIRGMFDTSHMGMWFQHFKKGHPNETEGERLGRFKKWYLDQVDYMHKEGVIGAVQLVDTATGAHAHLPAGQGILPVVEAATRLRKAGFKGFMVSEGHEEEGFGAGRILTETWRAFGALSGYNAYNQPVRWSDVANTHWGYAAPPNYIVGAYAPSNDWKLWSEVPFE